MYCCPPIMRTTAVWPRNIIWVKSIENTFNSFWEETANSSSIFRLLGYVGGTQWSPSKYWWLPWAIIGALGRILGHVGYLLTNNLGPLSSSFDVERLLMTKTKKELPKNYQFVTQKRKLSRRLFSVFLGVSVDLSGNSKKLHPSVHTHPEELWNTFS